MVIVAGWFEIDPAERDAFVAGRVEAMVRSRAEHGCIEYVIAADPVDPGRAVLFERWESQADLDAHAAAARDAARDAPKSDPPTGATPKAAKQSRPWAQVSISRAVARDRAAMSRPPHGTRSRSSTAAKAARVAARVSRHASSSAGGPGTS